MLHSIDRRPAPVRRVRAQHSEARFLLRTFVIACTLGLLALAAAVDGLQVFPVLLVLSAMPLLGWWLVNAAKARIRTAIHAAVSAERKRIADELHDFVAHDMAVVVVHAQALAVSANAAEAEQARQAISRSASRALNSMRQTIGTVRRGDGVVTRLRSVSDELQQLGYRVRCDIRAINGLSPASASALEHVASESATNIIKHCPRPADVRLSVSEGADHLLLSIWNGGPDDSGRTGTVSTPRIPSGGTGLHRLRELLGTDGGTLTAGPSGAGWVVTASVPRRR